MAILSHLFILLKGDKVQSVIVLIPSSPLFQNSWRWFNFLEIAHFNSNIFTRLLTRHRPLCCQCVPPTGHFAVLFKYLKSRKCIFSSLLVKKKENVSSISLLLILCQKGYLENLGSNFCFASNSCVLVLPIYSLNPLARTTCLTS